VFDRYLKSVEYEPAGEPSLFARWADGSRTDLAPPLAVGDPAYRAGIVETFACYLRCGRRLVSVGAGNGFVEAELAAFGWDVVATDCAASARALCRARGLKTAALDVMAHTDVGIFDAIYCDGVMGHLWEPVTRSGSAWRALARLGRAGSICVVSNDISEDRVAQFGVRSDPSAAFYRPPAGTFAKDALATKRWTLVADSTYEYARSGGVRRREILVARLLVDEGIDTEDRSQLARGEAALVTEARQQP
jgi:SAM-dependent methyltransferase